MTRTERGSATLHTLFGALLLFTALAAALTWSAISTARHKLTSAADLTALSAAQSLVATQPRSAGPSHGTAQTHKSAGPVGSNGQLEPPEQPKDEPAPCAVAARVAGLNKVRLIECDVASDAVRVEVSLEVDLRVMRPTLSAAARAGPV